MDEVDIRVEAQGGTALLRALTSHGHRFVASLPDSTVIDRDMDGRVASVPATAVGEVMQRAGQSGVIALH